MSAFYRLLLDDYSAASFTSFSKNYYGTLTQLEDFFNYLKSDKKTADRDVVKAYERYLAGEKDVTHNVAYRQVPFLTPVEVLGEKSHTMENFAWEHLNTWRWPYDMRFDRAECRHLWICCEDEYVRCISAKFRNLQYEQFDGKYDSLGGMIWGYPGQIVGRNGDLHTRLFVDEKFFSSKEDAMKDKENFERVPDPDFSRILDDIFGDG